MHYETIWFFLLLESQWATQEKILDISYKTGLIKRKRMIMPGDLLFAICNGAIQGGSSYNDLAMHIDYTTDKSVSKQAVAKKIKQQCKIFMQEVVKVILEKKLGKDKYIKVLKTLKDSFRPELLNRIDHTIFFNPLDQDSLVKIAELELDKLKQRILKQHRLNLTIEPKVYNFLCQDIADQFINARDIKRNIQDKIEAPLSYYLLDNSDKDININIKDNNITIC